MQTGRPTKYKPEYCAMLVKHMAQGFSFDSFCAVIKISKDALYEWTYHHPEFKDAKSLAFSECQLFWEKLGIAGCTGRINNFNASAWMFNMKHRFKWYEPTSNLPENHKIEIKMAYDIEKKKLKKISGPRVRSQENTNLLIKQGQTIDV